MKDSFLIFTSFYEPVKDLPESDKAKLLDAIFMYNISGEVPEMSSLCKVAFGFMKLQFDRNNEKYQSIVERNKANGAKGGRPPKNEKPENPNNPVGLLETQAKTQKPKKADNDNDNDNDNEKRVVNKKFTPPTLSDIQEYFTRKVNEAGLSIDPVREAVKFENFYASKGWYVGKNKMKEWKKSASLWITRHEPNQINSKPQIIAPTKGITR